MGFLADTETSISSGFTTVANTFGAGLLGVFRPVFIAGFTIWITLIAYEVAFGKSEDGFTYIFTKIGKIFFIGVLALYGWPELSEVLNGVKDGFVGANTLSTVLETNLMNPIAALWNELFRWFLATLQPLGFTDIGQIFKLLFSFAFVAIAYALMSLIVGIFAAVALAMYLVASAIFILLLAVGPFFLLCLAFPFTQRFFETFIGNVMTAVLAMAFTVLMVLFVANLFGLINIQTVVPTTPDITTALDMAKQMAVLFSSKAATAALIIYLTYKVFDLAAALGGGLNMGNNMIGGVRSIMKDLQRGGASSGSSSSKTNQISQGSGGVGTGSPARAARGNSTFTGMAASAAGPAVGAVGGAVAAGVRNLGSMASYGAGRAAGAAGRFAYNRYSQNQNRISKSS
jgi:type IV secretion system protein VirB6